MGFLKRKALVIGIDGATFRVIKPLIEKGKLPNIARMIEKGVHGVLSSTIPVVSAVAWTSFMTGKNPGKHQIFDFFGKIQGTYDFKLNTASDRKAKPIWINLSDENKRVLVLGVTMTYPPDPVNGYMVSGLGVPSDSDTQSYVYPPDFAKEIVANFGRFKTDPGVNLRKLASSDRKKERYLRGIFDLVDYRVKLFKHMWQKEAFDFSMIFFLDTDGTSHCLWKYMDSSHKHFEQSIYSDGIYKVYEKVDNAIGELLRIIKDEADVVLISDHGFGPLNRVVFLNNWLQLKGYLEFRDTSWTNATLLKLISLISRQKRLVRNEIEWQKTKAYFNGTVGNIFINLKGKDPEGIVNISKYDDLCNEIKRELLNLKDPETGEKIVDYVYKKEDLFKKKNIENAPDLIVTFKRGYSVVGEEIRLHDLTDTGQIISDSRNWSGIHEPEGVFVSYGKSFKNGYRVDGANIIDIAPTLLYLLGVPVPESMDGKILKDIFEYDFLESNPVSYIRDEDARSSGTEGLSEADTEKLRKQLRVLGYID